MVIVLGHGSCELSRAMICHGELCPFTPLGVYSSQHAPWISTEYGVLRPSNALTVLNNDSDDVETKISFDEDYSYSISRLRNIGTRPGIPWENCLQITYWFPAQMFQHVQIILINKNLIKMIDFKKKYFSFNYIHQMCVIYYLSHLNYDGQYKRFRDLNVGDNS